MLFFLANAVLTSLFNFVGSNTTTVFDVVLNLAHAQVKQIITSYLLAMRFVVRIDCPAITGFVFILDVVAALRVCRNADQQTQA